MAAILYAEDPEPSDRFPAGPLYVPVRPGPSGCAARLFRTPLGDRTAVGFTSEHRLDATLGPDQARIRLAEPALRALTAPLGVTTVTVDPQFTAPAPVRVTAPGQVARVTPVPPAPAPVVPVMPVPQAGPVTRGRPALWIA
ncbi:SAV_915 family protein [Streptomyces aureus]|uniref:SAV_915 family protein n=1 Tax=Streptomyces aureus TaxID=193461 RepID=UPI0036BF4A99